jgi:hypothetical protein
MFGSPSFIEPGQLRNPSAQLQRAQQQLAMPTNPSPAAVGLLNRSPVATGVAALPKPPQPLRPAQPATGIVPATTVPNVGPGMLQGVRAMRQPMGFGQAIRQPQNPPLA